MDPAPERSPADERPHVPGPELRWSESWAFDFTADDGSLGGWARITLLPHAGIAWYHAYLTGPDRQLAAVIDSEVPLPAKTLEIRTTGLWADHICETPHDHWTIGLEAFALGVDDPAEIHGRQMGDRVPLGFDLEWEAEGPSVGGADGYEQPSRVTGEILVGDAEIDFDGHGWRDHRWGARTDWDHRWVRLRGRLDDGTVFQAHVVGGDLTSARATIDGRPAAVTELSESLGAEGFPVGARLRLDGLELGIDPLAVTPLEIGDVEGRLARAPRVLCRYTTIDGRRGHGWAEWNQPQA